MSLQVPYLVLEGGLDLLAVSVPGNLHREGALEGDEEAGGLE